MFLICTSCTSPSSKTLKAEMATNISRENRYQLCVCGYIRKHEADTSINVPFAIQQICSLYFILNEKFRANGKNIKLNKTKNIAIGFNANPAKILASMDITKRFRIDHMNTTINSENIVYGTAAVGDIDESMNIYKWTFKILAGYFLVDEIQIGITHLKDIYTDQDEICFGFSSYGVAFGRFGRYESCKSIITNRKRWNAKDKLEMMLNISTKELQLRVNNVLTNKIMGIDMNKGDRYYLSIIMSSVHHEIKLLHFEALPL